MLPDPVYLFSRFIPKIGRIEISAQEILGGEISGSPHAIRPLSAQLVRRMQALTHGINSGPQEGLEDEALLEWQYAAGPFSRTTFS
jgi:hypothetical protein